MKIITLSLLLFSLSFNSASFAQDSTSELDALYAELEAIDEAADPAVEDEAADTDGDGLTDTQEAQIGTDPGKPDTDGDGLTDAQEVHLGTDPCNRDTDGGGVSDGEEAANDDWHQSDAFNPFDDFGKAIDAAPSDVGIEVAIEEVTADTATTDTAASNYDADDFLLDFAGYCGAAAAFLITCCWWCPPLEYVGLVLAVIGAVAGGIGLGMRAFDGPESNDDPLP